MRKSLVACAVLAIVALAGCVDYPFGAPWRDVSHHNSSSLVEFLYPGGRTPPHDNSVPELHLPLRVGLAFLPPYDGSSVGPDAALRQELLERVRQHFKDRKFVSEIVLVPDYYLTTRRGFEGLEAMQRLYAVDLMALVSYDQVTHGDTNEWSLGYLTIVGMYVLKGNRYDVSTVVDLAVVDPVSRSLVLRAGGTDVRGGRATLVAAAGELRQKSGYGFSTAADQMIEHFDTALNDFEAEVRAGHANVRVVHKDGRDGGGGALGWAELGFLALLAALRGAPAKTRRRAELPL
jgi:rhombotail lipoprotein